MKYTVCIVLCNAAYSRRISFYLFNAEQQHLCLHTFMYNKGVFKQIFTFWLELGVGPMSIPVQQVKPHFLHIYLIFSDHNKTTS